MLLVLLVAALLFTGCLQSGKHSITGRVTEADTGIPLWGVQVSIGSRRAVTNGQGYYQLSKVPGGKQLLKVELPGYRPFDQEVYLEGSATFDVGLTSQLPPVNSEAVDLRDWDFAKLDPSQIQVATVVVSPVWGSFIGNYQEGWTHRRTEVLLNGEPYFLDLSEYGLFYGPLPLWPGENTIQLRVTTHQGLARTSAPLTVNFAVERLDLHLLTMWEGMADLDVHLFKREPGEPNAFTWEDDRHVYWDNERPEDFGTDPDQNPIYEWDGWHEQGVESIALAELTPGDYHIWVHSWWSLEDAAWAVLEISLDSTTPQATTVSYDLDVPASSRFIPQYVATIRVAPDGSKKLLQVTPEPYVDEILAPFLGAEN